MAQSRLDLFRSYFARLDPAKPLDAENMYVAPPGQAVGRRLAARLLLAPTSTHLVVGSVGSGKTTQLLRAFEQLDSNDDVHAIYVDVSKRHDLEKDVSGVLVVLAGLEMSKLLKNSKAPEIQTLSQQFLRWANGHQEFIPAYEEEDYFDEEPGHSEDDDYEPGRYVSRPGVLSQPIPPLPSSLTERIDALRGLKAALSRPHIVILFDSLDRLDVDAFQKATLEDVRALKKAGIGSVIVGPGPVVYGVGRSVVDHLFDQIHLVPAADVARDDAARDFFSAVLSKRTDESVLGAPARAQLVQWSGGLLRDLLALTRSSVEEAFVSGADAVAEEHVRRAVDQFGRAMMIGLRKTDLEILHRLRKKGTFVPINESDFALLLSRRVIEYHGNNTRYSLHPTIAPLLDSLGGQV